MPRQFGSACVLKLASVAESVANAAHAEEGLHAVVMAAKEIYNPQTVAVVLKEKAADNLYIKLSRGLSAFFIDGFRRPLGSGILAEVVHGGAALHLSSPDDDPEAYNDVKLEKAFASAIAVALTINRKPVGYLYCDHAQPGYFSRTDLQILQCLGHLAALAIEKANLHARVARLAVKDPLTGLCTYNYFYSRLADEIARATRYSESLGLLLLELTNFAHVEDVCGRPGATKTLRDVARFIKEHTRGVDFATRFRTNQAMVCLVRSDDDGLKTAADRIMNLATSSPLTCPVEPGPAAPGEPARETVTRINLQVCAGGAIAPLHGTDPSILVAKAQKALLAAKRLGSGHLTIADS